LFEPSLFTDSNYWQTQAQYDVGISYLFERGKKRQHRLDAAKTATAVTQAQVADAQRTVLAVAAQLYVSALLQRRTWSSLKTCWTVTGAPSKSARIDSTPAL
jgi:cobalt-zinc-cadmium efflux system outer membrane protein